MIKINLKKILKYSIFLILIPIMYILLIEIYVYFTRQKTFILNNFPITIKDRYLDIVDVSGELIYKRVSYFYKTLNYTLKNNDYISLFYIGNDGATYHIMANKKNKKFSKENIEKFKKKNPNFEQIDNKNCDIYYVSQTHGNELSHFLVIYMQKKSLLFTVSSSEKKVLLENIDTFCK